MLFPSSIGAVLDHIADILSSPGLSTAQDLQTLPEDYKDFDKNFKKFVSNAQNVDSKYSLVKFLLAWVSRVAQNTGVNERRKYSKLIPLKKSST